MPIHRIQLHHNRLAQSGVRHAVAEHDPPIRIAALASAGVGGVDGLEVAEVDRIALAKDRQRTSAGVVAQNTARPSGRILAVAQRQKENGAQRNPQRVEQPVAAPHARYHSGPMTRAEIEDKLVTIVRNEKSVPDDKLSLETPLAEAGIDSLDALSILFAIEEEFHISIPDDRARSMRTFGDLVDSIEMLLPS
jgi:acyl carrier protein